jgi:hypothetical protein
MNSRKMESLRGSRGKKTRLHVLLPKDSTLVATVNGAEGLDDFAAKDGTELDVRRAQCLAALDGGPFDALLWTTRADEVTEASLDLARSHLKNSGRLLVQGLGDGDGDGDDEADEEARVRFLVARLSEAGFVITKELARESVVGGRGPVVMARPDEFRVRSFREGDEAAIAELFRRSFHVDRAAEQWRWKYHENPWKNLIFSLAFTPSGEAAVANFGGYAVPFWRDGQSCLAVQMGDTMTDPRFRDVGRGTSALLARTVRYFFAVHRQGPVGFYYGFNTGPIQRFCGWFVGVSRAVPVAYRRLEMGHQTASLSTRGYRVERVTRTSSAWDRFFRRVAPHYRFLVRRGASYVDWRYFDCPDDFVVLAAWRFRRLVGWSVFRRHEERLVWGDALISPRHPKAGEALLAAALQREELRGGEAVVAWFPEHPAFFDAELRRLGFENRDEPEALGCIYLSDTVSHPPLGQIYYTMGDSDLF